ncbi:MAG: hypothetical protein U1F16_17370 [Turneriella sp.]
MERLKRRNIHADNCIGIDVADREEITLRFSRNMAFHIHKSNGSFQAALFFEITAEYAILLR